jgi:hypothetical protein
MVRLAEAAGYLGGAFGFEIFPLGFGFLPLPSKSATLVQTGVEHTPLQWRRAFDPEPY